MKRSYKFGPLPLNLTIQQFRDFAEDEYRKRYRDSKSPFSYCIIYLVVNPDKSMRLVALFQEDVPLLMSFIHKRPQGGIKGEPISNTDIREFTDIKIPPFENKYHFDFVFLVLDPTTQGYWATNLWTQTVCADLRFYLSTERKNEYKKLGSELSKKYNQTFVLGHVNLVTGRLKGSAGISRLINHGWIPTISLFPQPYGEMVRCLEEGNSVSKITEIICNHFRATDVIEKMVERWSAASITQKRRGILKEALSHFSKKDFVATTYILLPQIEGLITEHIKRKRAEPKEGLEKRFAQFGELIAGETYNTEMTKYLIDIFMANLKKVYYKRWYPHVKNNKKYLGSPIVPQRHILLHGNIKPQYFTEENCIKLICMIDNIILLSLRKSEIAIKR